MKKSFFLAVAAVAMTACSNDVDLGLKDATKQTADNAIGFEVRNSNMSRGTDLKLQATGHYNFGVFGHKHATPSAVMENYLVGYMDATNKKGYFMTTTNQTTNGDAQGNDNGKSMWSYEKLGYEDYTYTESEGYYTKDNNTEYMSNFKNQFLRYWDHSTDWTKFYAYAPYIKGREKTSGEDPLTKGVVTFDNNTHKMTFPAGTIKAGYDDPSKYEYLYAATKVNNIEYGKDVALTFKHINSKIMITFWEDIAGYSVQMIDLVSGQTGVSAAPAKIVSNNAYKYGTLVKSAGAVLEFTESDNIDNPTVTAVTFNYRVPYNGVDVPTAEFLKFETPEATTLAANRQDAVAGSYPTNKNFSKTVYYAIPKNNNSGLTFHCSFILTNEQTHETIKVQDARVHVKAENCNWEAGKRYIYVFKITKDATGTTGNPEPIIPGDPSTGTQALHPIVFDGITVEDWAPATESDHDIN